MLWLLVFAALWLFLHLGVSGTSLRGALVGRVGEKAFRAGFAVASLVLLVLMSRAYAGSDMVLLWIPPDWVRWLLALALLPACVLLVLSFRRNPTAAGGEALLGQEVTGVQRVTRHPMMLSFTIWAAVHVIGVGDLASVLFFGTFLLTAALGMPSLDRKLAARAPQTWAVLAARTSIVPFAAIAAGRNRFMPAEIGLAMLAAGVALWLALLLLHQSVVGVPPVAF